jgi:hypothetical protein
MTMMMMTRERRRRSRRRGKRRMLPPKQVGKVGGGLMPVLFGPCLYFLRKAYS